MNYRYPPPDHVQHKDWDRVCDKKIGIGSGTRTSFYQNQNFIKIRPTVAELSVKNHLPIVNANP